MLRNSSEEGDKERDDLKAAISRTSPGALAAFAQVARTVVKVAAEAVVAVGAHALS
jgi:hypothetical protein